jgi:hypothetical protein
MDRFSEEHFRNDDAARAFLETLLWPEGPSCPHCGVVNHAYPTKRAVKGASGKRLTYRQPRFKVIPFRSPDVH